MSQKLLVKIYAYIKVGLNTMKKATDIPVVKGLIDHSHTNLSFFLGSLCN